MKELSQPYLINSAADEARPKMLGLPPRPRQIAQTILLFPEPFGPIITFRCGPGFITRLSYVLKHSKFKLEKNNASR